MAIRKATRQPIPQITRKIQRRMPPKKPVTGLRFGGRRRGADFALAAGGMRLPPPDPEATFCAAT